MRLQWAGVDLSGLITNDNQAVFAEDALAATGCFQAALVFKSNNRLLPSVLMKVRERLLQFNKNRKFNMYQEEVMVQMGEWAHTRLKNLSETDKTRDNPKVGSGFGKNISNWLVRDKAYPTNVLHLGDFQK